MSYLKIKDRDAIRTPGHEAFTFKQFTGVISPYLFPYSLRNFGFPFWVFLRVRHAEYIKA